ncbi:OmpA family protein [Endomicrobium proavitum]|uniref:OmpA-like domain-containing protein n=1 Tax=Endomicrobium proavitum TaxID=1408281 RepID=A0A0G3WIR4_9BACT|nr:OmpA family protein [Endomicrobium proavitum]AKL98531.1 exported protein of unknown function [Endomicrobium proavitum]
MINAIKIFTIVFVISFVCAGALFAKEYVSDSATSAAAVKAGSKIIIPGFYFDKENSSNASLKKRVKNVAAQIKKVKFSKVIVEGYADNSGTSSQSLKNSKSRANFVRKELIKNGIPAKKVTIKSFGSVNPLASNGDDQGRMLNRRVELLLVR